MNETPTVERFDVDLDNSHCNLYGMQPSDDGEWVRYTDYASLLAENRELQASIARADKDRTIHRNKRIEAELARDRLSEAVREWDAVRVAAFLPRHWRRIEEAEAKLRALMESPEWRIRSRLSGLRKLSETRGKRVRTGRKEAAHAHAERLADAVPELLTLLELDAAKIAALEADLARLRAEKDRA